MLYASLTGPLLGVYYPVPTNNNIAARLMLNTSKLRSLWCSVYTEQQVNDMIQEFRGIKLPQNMAYNLDYDYHKCEETWDLEFLDLSFESVIIRRTN